MAFHDVNSSCLCGCLGHWQQRGNGQLFISGGLATSGRVTVSGGLNVPTGGLSVGGTVLLSTGSMHITSPVSAATSYGFAVENDSGSGNTLSGRVATGTANANAMTLTDGTTVHFQV